MTSTSLATTNRPSASRGFTLLEMLIVLAILAAVTAWTWPSLRRQMIASELRDAGKQVRAELARARLRAVETGTVQQFRFQPGKRAFEVIAAPPVAADGTPADVDRPANDAPPIGRGMAKAGDEPERLEADRQALPEGAYFLSPATAIDSMPVAAFDSGSGPADATGDDNGTPAVESIAPTIGQGDDLWSPPIVFYPNGRTSDARIRLANRAGAHVEVTLRGLTGVAKVGRLQRRKVR